MLKYIPTSWKNDMRTNFDHRFRWYINPRCRVFPALTDTGNTFIKNDQSTDMRGTYRMQTSSTTALTYAYQLPQRFIIEGWFKPEFAYDTATSQFIFNALIAGSEGMTLVYRESLDKIGFFTNPSNTYIYTPAFTSDAELQQWIYVRCYYDNLAKLKGFYCTVNGEVYADTEQAVDAGTFTPLATSSFFKLSTYESSYWIIHELDETLTTDEYKTYEADRQIIFDFNGTTLGRERIYIPNVHASGDQRGVKSFSYSGSVEDPMSGSAGANSLNLTLLNATGSFSDDQYDAFDPFNGYYNGTQKYLQNRVQVEMESQYTETAIPSPPTGDCAYLQWLWETIDSWSVSNSTIVAERKYLVQTVTDANPNIYRTFSFDGSLYYKIRMRFRQTAGTIDTVFRIYYSTGGHAYSSSYYKNVTVAPVLNEWVEVSTSMDSLTVGGNDFITNTITGIRFDISNTGYAGQIFEIDYIYIGDDSYLSDMRRECCFIGRTTPGAFTRTSPNAMYGEASINVEDGIAELGETNLPQAYGFDSYDLSDPTSEATSLVHAIARLVTKKEIRNYALNSSFENATIGNSWTASGLTASRSSTVALFGTYSGKMIIASAGDYMRQKIIFETIDKIDVGDVFNFSAWIYQGTASTLKIIIEELTSAGALVGTGSETATGTDTAVWTRINVSRTILSATCTQLRITFYGLGAATNYADGVMLTRGIDPLDYFLLNATDGSGAAGSADSAATTTYDTVAIDAEAVDVEHPYALLDKGSSVWEAEKKIGDASIASYMGMTPDGVLNFRVRYNELNEDNLGDVDNVAGVATSMTLNDINAVKVHGVIIKEEAANKQLFTAEGMPGITVNTGNKVMHPINDAAYMLIAGATTMELKYTEDD